MARPGMLFVTMQPQPGLSIDQFHEWYNNEHGPTRLRLPAIFATGQRYCATDAQQPTFLATYDVDDMALLTTPAYTDLRANRSPREAKTIGQVSVKRFLLELQSSRQSTGFVPFAGQSDEAVDGTELVVVTMTLQDIAGAEEQVIRWYEEEHFPLLTKVPGWLRTRRYSISDLDQAGAAAPFQLISLHEYQKNNGLGGPEHRASMDTPWREEMYAKYAGNKGRRTYKMFYVFSSAPRDLEHLARLPECKAFVSADRKTTTTPRSGDSVVCSYITTADGLVIPYRLEGNPASDAPTVAFSNSLLTSLKMWDGLVAILKKSRPDLRVLRYDTRGRHGIPKPPVPATMEMLADDLYFLIKELRISKLEALVGVSLGGATTLQFALKYTAMVSKFIACDFNISGSEANTVAWKDRVDLVESTSAGMGALAPATVARWFYPSTLSGKTEITQVMTDMVAANTTDGFKYSCQALWDFDLREAAKDCRVPGLLVVGEGDGKGALVKAMGGFQSSIGPQGANLKIVPRTGHLPMYEDPQAFWESVEHFL